MEALFFGETSAPLYGVYHPAKVDRDRLKGIVLCPPFGQEYMRSHRSMRMLANSLSSIGFHVLRFDYHGTGNSSRELPEVTPEIWVENIALACEELHDIAGIGKSSLIGLRLGGLLAGLAAAARPSIVDQIVLWDPIINGNEYITELENAIQKSGAGHRSNFVGKFGEINFNGFQLNPEFQQSLKRQDLCPTISTLSIPVLQIVSHESQAFSQLHETAEANPSYNFQVTPAPHDWNYVDDVGGIMLPIPIMNKITEWLDNSSVEI